MDSVGLSTYIPFSFSGFFAKKFALRVSHFRDAPQSIHSYSLVAVLWLTPLLSTSVVSSSPNIPSNLMVICNTLDLRCHITCL